MGTFRDWANALVWGGIFGVFMAWVMTRTNMPESVKVTGHAHRISFTIFCVLMGLVFQLVDDFGWRRSFQAPLVFVLLTAIAALFLVGHKLRSAAKNVGSR